MRTLIVNANVVTGDGKTVLENRSVVIENGLIESIRDAPCPIYDNAHEIVDARGGYVIPGIINRHTHCVSTAPYPCDYALPALPRERALQNLEQHLLEGETTVVSQDGFMTFEELEDARRLSPLRLQMFGLQMPLHFEKARRFSCGGVREKHQKVTIEEMVAKGAIGIGEVGAFGIAPPPEGREPDISYIDVEFFPFLIRNETGHPVTTEQARSVRLALFDRAFDERALSELLRTLDIEAAKPKLLDFREHSVENAWLNIRACEEAVTYAKRLNLPLDFHNAPQTRDQVVDFAKRLGPLFHAAHSNFLYKPSEAIEVARKVKDAGGWIDVNTGNFFRSRQFFKNHVTTMALLEEGLVDMISTDYMGGYWDPILRVLEYFIQQNVIGLPQAIAMVSRNVVQATPNVAPSCGEVKAGMVADLAVLDRSSVAKVDFVIIGGRTVVRNGQITREGQIAKDPRTLDPRRKP
jgi:imidazolonepropionase-like amidohydrolase